MDPYPDSMGSLDLDPDSPSGSGSRKAKMTHKKCSLLGAEGFSCSLDVF